MRRSFAHALTNLTALATLSLSAQSERALRLQQPVLRRNSQEARVALVIGNGDYEEGPLKNPCRDAQAMKTALEACQFKVTLLENAHKKAMEDAIKAFGDQLRDGVVGLVYYAGHGLQLKGENYLVPTDARLDQEEDVPYRAVNVGLLLDRMEGARNSVNILILDACRNNPFAPSWRRGNAEKGLASVNAPRGSLISYATAAGRTAADGAGEHGAYTGALLAELQDPGLRVEEVFKKVRARVLAVSGGQQLPFESTSLVGDFYFRPARTAEDCARDEVAVLAEIRRLETALKTQETQARTADALKQAELQRAQLKTQELERQRLVLEGARRQELAGEARKAREEEARRQEEAARLEALKQRLAQRQRALGEGQGGMTLKGARQEWARLQAQQADLMQRLQDQQTQALARVDHEDAARSQRLDAPRDEFETADQYQARQLEAGTLKARLLRERETLQAQAGPRTTAQLKPLWEAATALEQRRFPVTYPVDLGTYDSDLGRFTVRIPVDDGRSAQADLALEPARARSLKGRKEPPRAEGRLSLRAGPEILGRINDPVWGSLPLTHLQMTVAIGQGPALELVAIPPGTFMMGAPGRQHEVTLTKAFWLGKCAITQAQWEAVMGQNPSHFKGEQLPVENVSWEDCSTFLERLNARGQGVFRLPTEAEWEYACRAGSTAEPGGDPGLLAWHAGNSGLTTHPVGQKPPNAFGLYDMNGNVWQWCQDWYGDYPPGPVTDPQGPPSGPARVNRGGSWHDPAELATWAHTRDGNGPGLRCGSLGLRVLMTCP